MWQTMRKTVGYVKFAVSTVIVAVGTVQAAEVIDMCFRPVATPTAKVMSSLNSIDAKLKDFHREIARLESIEANLKHQGDAISQLLEAVGKKG
jgi:hypothetical protein